MEGNMQKERAIQIINAFVNNLLISERPKDVIQYLLYIGVTKQELENVFGFNRSDIIEAENDMDKYLCALTLSTLDNTDEVKSIVEE